MVPLYYYTITKSLETVGNFPGHFAHEVPALPDREHRAGMAVWSKGAGCHNRLTYTCCVAGVHGTFCRVIAHLPPSVCAVPQCQESGAFVPTFKCEREAACWKEQVEVRH